MDRGALSGAINQGLGAVFTEALAAAVPTLLTADRDGIERCVQAVGRQGLGRVVEQVVAARAAALDPAAPACAQRGAPTRCVGRARPRRLRGLVGDSTLRRPSYACAACRHGRAPLAAQLGLGRGALSSRLSRVAGRLGSEGAFGAAADQLAEPLGVTVSEEAGRRVTAGGGAVAEAEQQAALARARLGWAVAPRPRGGDEAPPVTVVAVDGVQAPVLDGWHELKVSRVAPLGPALRADPETGRTHLALGPSGAGAGLEPAEARWCRAYVEACRQGLGTGVRTVAVLGDGAEWIWTHAPRFLGGAGAEVVEVVDISHAYEHLWTVGNAVFGPGAPAAAAWVEPLKDRLDREGAAPVLAALAALAPPDAAAAEAVRLALGDFTGHAARMDYPRFVARRFPIGSGAVESACKGLVQQRAKQAGRRGSRPGLQAVASRRALHRSGHWAAFWRTQPQRRRPPVAPRAAGPPPAPTPAAAPALVMAAEDARLALLPRGRTSDAPPSATPAPAPAPRRPAPDHPWRQPLPHRRLA
jgi:hypothetical protein